MTALDGLNEIPVAHRALNVKQVRDLLAANPAIRALVSCRQLDYRDLDLGLDTLTIQPLDPDRILEFLEAHLGAESFPEVPEFQRVARATGLADSLFWQLAGGPEVREVFEVWQQAGADLALFFSASDIPSEKPDVYSKTTKAQVRLWREKVRNPRNLITVARNPYMLAMIVGVAHVNRGSMPGNRADLFDQFVHMVLLRERLAREEGTSILLGETAHSLLTVLEALAWNLQTSGSQAEPRLAMPRTEALAVLTEEQLRLAAGASLVESGDPVRFSHQLLQEYFAARALRTRIERDGLAARELWRPGAWWESSGWEETTVLLAGLHEGDCSRVIEWLAEANPEASARCARLSGAAVPKQTLVRLRDAWKPRLADVRREPQPQARAAVGRALGMLMLDGAPLDDRRGVGVKDGLPDIDWAEIPAGEFQYQDEKRKRNLPAY